MTYLKLAGAASLLVLASACSEETQSNAQDTLERAAADTEANAEVVENAVREGTMDAAEGISQSADNLQAELAEDEAIDPDQGDGALDGTD